MIGDGDRVHAELLALGKEVFETDGAIEHTVLAMDVEMDEVGSGKFGHGWLEYGGDKLFEDVGAKQVSALPLQHKLNAGSLLRPEVDHPKRGQGLKAAPEVVFAMGFQGESWLALQLGQGRKKSDEIK
jgi:hypothetical protein